MNNSKSKNKAHRKINSNKKYNKLNHRLIKVKVHLEKIYNKMRLK